MPFTTPGTTPGHFTSLPVCKCKKIKKSEDYPLSRYYALSVTRYNNYNTNFQITVHNI